ncbi:MAG TPA: RNA-guided endonuclease IscB, partial [Ktedonosporobacter sp.]|nr:RNA-guided endonuclease IscB [Ktedonosporobacter sp.]
LKHEVEEPVTTPLRIKIDPGSKTTGLALVNDATGQVVFAAELTHRGQDIKESLDDRRMVRKSRRRRQTRYRQPRFSNRRNQKKGWLPPSLKSRISNIETWVKRLTRLCLIGAISQELVKFDLQHMEHPEIEGTDYQQGTLAGYEVREYLLEKWQRKCAYCGKKKVPLQIEHIVPRARGGSDRISNLCLSCESCNKKKGTQDLKDFLKKQPDRLKKIQAQAKAPLKDATAVNATRWALFHRLEALGVPVECGSGGLTKFNRTQRALPKTHWMDAVCVGKSTPLCLHINAVVPLFIKASGYGNRQMCGVDKYGFPYRHRQRKKVHFGYQTGDMIRAVVPDSLKCAGTHVGRVLVRAKGKFDIRTQQGRITDVPHRFCRPIHRNDGYSYRSGKRHASPA